MSDNCSQNNKLQLLGKLNASFVHEVRNPLFALSLNLDYLKMSDPEMAKESKEALDSCIEAVDRINILVENVLSFSKKHKTHPVFCSLNAVVRQAIDLVNGYARNNHCILEPMLNDDIPDVYFDNNKLLQVLLNLLTNAIEASTTRKIVNIKTYNNNGIIYLEVEDFGKGIKEEERERIFSDFYTDKINGTGLGLSICRSIVSEFNAELDFESKYLKGTRFLVKFSNNNSEK